MQQPHETETPHASKEALDTARAYLQDPHSRLARLLRAHEELREVHVRRWVLPER